MMPIPVIGWPRFGVTFKRMYAAVKKSKKIFDSPNNDSNDYIELTAKCQLADLGELSKDEMFQMRKRLEFHLKGYLPIMIHNKFTRNRQVIVYFHGNSEDIGSCFAYCAQIHQLLGVG